MPRSLLIFALCLPLAILIGYMLSDPLMQTNRMFVSGAMCALLIPLVLKIHHRALIWVAGAVMIASFIKGAPAMWMVMAMVSFGIAILSRPLTKVRMKPVWDKWVLATLLLFTVCVITTAMTTGGIGLRVFGSAMFGGRKYFTLLAAVIGFVALTLTMAQRRFVQRDIAIFTLGPVTTAFSNVAYILGPSFYFLFLVFPMELAINQAQADMSPMLVAIKRYTGFGGASTAICMFCIMRWGIRGLADITKPWRIGMVIAALFIGMLSGFRSTLVLPVVVAMIQFFAEGLHRTKYLAGFVGFFVGGLMFLAAFSESLPLSAQRAISFLPVRVDPVAAADAKTSLMWRVEMWRLVSKEIPKNLWLGKGYGIDPTDLYLAEESFKRGYLNDYELAIRSADYHSGFLSIVVPFGVAGGVAAFLFFVAALRVVYRNMQYGDAEIQNINTFIFSLYVGRLVYFFLFFGGIETDLWFFASLVGISLSINGGVKGPLQKEGMRFDLKRGKARADQPVADLAPA